MRRLLASSFAEPALTASAAQRQLRSSPPGARRERLGAAIQGVSAARRGAAVLRPCEPAAGPLQPAAGPRGGQRTPRAARRGVRPPCSPSPQKKGCQSTGPAAVRATVGSLTKRQDTAGSGSCSPRGSVGERAGPFPPAPCRRSRYCCFGKGARVVGESRGKRQETPRPDRAGENGGAGGLRSLRAARRDCYLSPPAAEPAWAGSPWPTLSLGHGSSTSPCGLCCCLWA